MAVIGIEHLAKEIETTLTVYSKETTEKLKSIANKYSKILKKQTKANAPVGKRKDGKYKDSISCKKRWESANGVSYVWYVNSKDSNYRLTHLLVNGHVKRNGGRTKPNNFLRDAVSEVTTDYLKEVEEAIKNG